jgi:hypothetical protein
MNQTRELHRQPKVVSLAEFRRSIASDTEHPPPPPRPAAAAGKPPPPINVEAIGRSGRVQGPLVFAA